MLDVFVIGYIKIGGTEACVLYLHVLPVSQKHCGHKISYVMYQSILVLDLILDMR